jgi:hypothetical protein
MIDYDALVLTHPYELFEDNSEVRTRIESVVQEEETDVIGVRPSAGSRSLEDPIGGRDNYDMWVEDKRGYGRVEEEDIVEISNNYDDLGLGGYYRHKCVSRTKGSFVDQGVEIQVAEQFSRESDALSLI